MAQSINIAIRAQGFCFCWLPDVYFELAMLPILIKYVTQFSRQINVGHYYYVILS